jgi:hypothetical protein
MKSNYKIIILVLVACLSSIAIYYNVETVLPVDTKEHILITQEKIEKGFIDDFNYTFDNPKVILNPYKISPLTAIVIFETKDLTTPKLTVKGKDEKTTYSKTFIPGKKHILPVYGLYADHNNEVIIEMNGKMKTLNIKTDKLPDDFKLPTTILNNKNKLNNDLYFVTPASVGYTSAYDMNGDVRWYLTESYGWDIQRLNNGNIMLGTDRLINPPYYNTGLVEMDLLGKIYYEYSLPGGYHHDVYEMENGNLLVASDNFEAGTVEDYIVEIDRETGKIIKYFDLQEILPVNEGNNLYSTSYDWFHNNSVWYDKKTNSITLSGRHNDSVINIDYDTKQLNWIVGDNDKWSESMQKYFFTPTNDLEWQWAQHAAMILPNGNLFLFDNGNNRSKNEDGAIAAIDNYSRAVIYELNKNDMTINQVWQYGKDRGSDFYSPYISDVDFINNNHYLVHSGGISYKDGQVQNDPASLVQADTLNSITVEILNDEVIFEMHLSANYYRAEKMSLYSNANFKLGVGKNLGNMGVTPTVKNTSIVMFNRNINNEFKKHNVEFIKEYDRLVVSGIFKKEDKVEIILDSVFSKRTYELKVSKKPYTAMCIDIFNEEELQNGIKVYKYINDTGLSGKYYLYMKINGTIYDLNQYVVF